MNYPNSINKEYHKVISHANRGMDLEAIINETNEYLREKDIALIYKKPTPIGISDVEYKNNHAVIKKGYFAYQSTLDYNGLYKGKYLEFEAKNTESKTSFPLNNIHEHQIKHIRKVIKHNGIVFLIVRINNEIYLLMGKDFINYIDNHKRKSIPYSYFQEFGYLLKYYYGKGLNYLQIIDNFIRSDMDEKNQNKI